MALLQRAAGSMPHFTIEFFTLSETCQRSGKANLGITLVWNIQPRFANVSFSTGKVSNELIVEALA